MGMVYAWVCTVGRLALPTPTAAVPAIVVTVAFTPPLASSRNAFTRRYFTHSANGRHVRTVRRTRPRHGAPDDLVAALGRALVVADRGRPGVCALPLDERGRREREEGWALVLLWGEVGEGGRGRTCEKERAHGGIQQFSTIRYDDKKK